MSREGNCRCLQWIVRILPYSAARLSRRYFYPGVISGMPLWHQGWLTSGWGYNHPAGGPRNSEYVAWQSHGTGRYAWAPDRSWGTWYGWCGVLVSCCQSLLSTTCGRRQRFTSPVADKRIEGRYALLPPFRIPPEIQPHTTAYTRY